MPIVPSIPDNAPFTAEQRLWLNGFLAGLLAGDGASRSPAVVEPPTIPLVVLYGSQTGTAERLSKLVAKECAGHRFKGRVVDAAAHAGIDWKAEKNLLIITSTYGDGDMPDNAVEFWNWLQTEAASSMAHVAFSVLALGDTNYPEFCAAGKKIDARLGEIGARRIFERVDCDLDYEIPAKAWMENALAALAAESGIGGNLSAGAASTESATAAAPAKAWSKANPYPARLRTNRLLNAEGSAKETRHFEFELEDKTVSYESGDALGVYPCNCPELVATLLAALGCDGEEAVPSPDGRELPLRKALTESFEVNKAGPELLKRMAETNATLRELLAEDRKEDLRKWLWGRDLADLLQATPAFRPAPAEFARLLKKLPPRLYSISSSPKEHAGQVHLTVGIVRYESHGRPRKGVCSTFLADRAREPVPVFVHASPGFKLPTNGDAPIIMVGPGTGVAPFRGFLHERRATGAKGRNWLVFGDQRSSTDFYYREEWERMTEDGHLSRLDTAFSRDQSEKIYVQHRLAEQAAEIWAWLQDGAHFYVCGDASRMAKDVDVALHQVAEKAGGLSPDAAAEYVRKLKAEKRYQRDVY